MEKESDIEIEDHLEGEAKKLAVLERKRREKENFERALTMVEMFGPELAPKKMSISMTKKSWSNPFLLRLKGTGHFKIFENLKDQEMLRKMHTNKTKTKRVKLLLFQNLIFLALRKRIG